MIRPTANRTVVRACRRADAQFSLVMTRNPAIQRAIAEIEETAWTPVSYPGAVRDPDTGAWISDAEVAEISYTAFASTKDRVTARLVVRRVKDARFPDALFPRWRYHPFVTNTDLPVEQADITHRQHAIIETVFADLIDGPLAHIPSGRFGANSAWVLCAAIAHNLLRAAGVLAGDQRPPSSGNPDYDPAPDSYADFATAAKTWWLFALVMFGCAFIVAIFVTQRQGPWYALGASAVMVIMPLLAGHQDSSWGYQVARRQWVPFAVAGVATLGTFTALYFFAYAAGRRWPLRPKGSMEYRAHPHLRKKFP